MVVTYLINLTKISLVVLQSLLIVNEVNVTFEYWKPIRADKVVRGECPKILHRLESYPLPLLALLA